MSGLTRFFQLFFFGVAGATLLRKFLESEGFLEHYYALLALVSAAIGSAMVLTASDKSYIKEHGKTKVESLMRKGGVFLLACVSFSVLYEVFK